MVNLPDRQLSKEKEVLCLGLKFAPAPARMSHAEVVSAVEDAVAKLRRTIWPKAKNQHHYIPKKGKGASWLGLGVCSVQTFSFSNGLLGYHSMPVVVRP